MQLKRPATETIQEEQFKTIASILLSLKFKPENIPPHVCYNSMVLLKTEFDSIIQRSEGITLGLEDERLIDNLAQSDFFLPVLLACHIMEYRNAQTPEEKAGQKGFIDWAETMDVLPLLVINNALTYIPQN